MINVYSVCTGSKYPLAYVYALRDMVQQYLTIPHTFICISDRDIPDIKTIQPPVIYQSWWDKINLFNYADGKSLFFDLDVVIVGNINYLVDYAEYELAAPANWAQSGHGGIQSSVLAWNGLYKEPCQVFDPDKHIKQFWGDQEFLTYLRGDAWIKIPGVGSYKYHCRNAIKDDLRVITFHGDPKPHVVNDDHILPYTKALRGYLCGTGQQTKTNG